MSSSPRYTCSNTTGRCEPSQNGRFNSLEECQKYCWLDRITPDLAYSILSFIPEDVSKTDVDPRRQLREMTAPHSCNQLTDEEVREIFDIFENNVTTRKYYATVFKKYVPLTLSGESVVWEDALGDTVSIRPVSKGVSRYHSFLKYPCMYKVFFNLVRNQPRWDGMLYDYEVDHIINVGTIDSIELAARYSNEPLDKLFGLTNAIDTDIRSDFQKRYFTYKPRFPYRSNLYLRTDYYRPKFLRLIRDEEYFNVFADRSRNFCTWLVSHFVTSKFSNLNGFDSCMRNLIHRKGIEWVQYAIIIYTYTVTLASTSTLSEDRIPDITDSTTTEELRVKALSMFNDNSDEDAFIDRLIEFANFCDIIIDRFDNLDVPIIREFSEKTDDIIGPDEEAPQEDEELDLSELDNIDFDQMQD